MNLDQRVGRFLRERFPFLFSVVRFCYQSFFIIACKFSSGSPISCRRITNGDSEHLFGYYDKSPWDIAGEKALCLSVPFGNRHPTVDDAAQILLIEMLNNVTHVVGETHAWNLQQGCRLQWLGPDFKSKIVYNDFRNGHYVSIVHDLVHGTKRVIDRPIYDITNVGKTALSLNYERINMFRQGYGYSRGEAALSFELFPENDGIWSIDMVTGANRLIISFAEFARNMGEFWEGISATRFKHIMINPSGTRFMFLYRRRERNNEVTSLYTSGMDGANIYCLETDGMVSHATWKDNNEILVWARRKGAGDGFYLFTDGTDRVAAVGPNILKEDGHPSFSPCNRYILLDTYADRARMRSLYVFDMATSEVQIIDRFYTPFQYSGEIRCDLHPRWKRDGSQVCIDSTHEGNRQVYVVDLPPSVTNRTEAP